MLSPRLARAYGAHADAPKKRITPAPMPKRHRSSLPLHCAFRRVDHAPPIHRAVLRWMKRRHPPFVLREGKDAARSLPALSPGPSPMNGRGERFRRVDHAPSIHRSVLRWMKKRHPPFVLREGKDAARSLPALSPGPSPMNGRGERFRRVNYDPPIHRSTDPPIHRSTDRRCGGGSQPRCASISCASARSSWAISSPRARTKASTATGR